MDRKSVLIQVTLFNGRFDLFNGQLYHRRTDVSLVHFVVEWKTKQKCIYSWRTSILL